MEEIVKDRNLSDKINAGKKNQHYVSVFYLKNFSIKRKLLSKYTPATNEFTKDAIIKKEARIEYYYGEDGIVEDMLADVENKFAPVIKGIIETNILPKNTSDKRFVQLLELMLIMDLRNPVRKRQIEAVDKNFDRDNLINTVVLKHPKLKPHSEKLRIIAHNTALRNPAIEALRKLGLLLNGIVDLRLKLIINETTKPFLTSDNPVVIYNQFFELGEDAPTTSSYACEGFQAFWPISSKLLLMLYDSRVYYVGKKKGNTVKLERNKNENDVNSLNKLQFLSCFTSVYGRENLDEKDFETIHQQVKDFPLPQILKKLKESDSRVIDLRINLFLSFVALSNYGSVYKFRPRYTPLRKLPQHWQNVFESDHRQKEVESDKTLTEMLANLDDQGVEDLFIKGNFLNR